MGLYGGRFGRDGKRFKKIGGIFMDLDKDKFIAKELRNLKKIAKNVPSDKKLIADSIIKELSFMAYTLEELRQNVKENGAVDYFVNGKQEMWRESPALKSYSTMIQRYSLLYKQLTDLLPKSSDVQNSSELIDFLNEE